MQVTLLSGTVTMNSAVNNKILSIDYYGKRKYVQVLVFAGKWLIYR